MQRLVVTLHERAVALDYPASCAREVGALFGAMAPPAVAMDAVATRTVAPAAVITVTEATDSRYAIESSEPDPEQPPLTGLSHTELCARLVEEIVRLAVTGLASAVALHAGAVGWNGRSVLFVGESGTGKSSLVAWFLDRGFRYLSDELVALVDSAGGIVGLPRPLVLKARAAELAGEFPCFAGAHRLRIGSNLIICPDRAALAAPIAHPCGLIVFTAYAADAALAIEPLSPAQATLRLMGCNVNARNLPDGGFGAISALAQAAPAVVLHYGDFAQLESLADVLAKRVLAGDLAAADIRRFLSAFAGRAAAPTAPPARAVAIPAATPRRNEAKLTIGMATYDDYDGVYFSLQALRLYHPEILEQTEFVLIDNHPEGAAAQALKAFETWLPNYRYVPENTRSGTAVRNAVFAEAAGDFVLCMDCHVFIVPGAVKRLLDYFARNETTSDLLQGPLLHDDLKKIGTNFSPVWSGGMYGRWEDNGLAADVDAAPFDIAMQGLGLFACRRAAWPGFNPAFRGFGGEEGYIHEKFRRGGGRTLCLPFLRWLHRFDRPLGVPYRNAMEDRMWNYMVGWRELSWPTDELQAHFRELLGPDTADAILREIEDERAGC